MRAHREITIAGKRYLPGDTLPWGLVYPFFLLHMLAFGGSGFLMAYGDNRPDPLFLYLHGGLAITVYVFFYLAVFGPDRVRWMFINAGLGLFGIYAQIDLILSLFGKRADDFPARVHLIPFLYYVLYTFLLYQLVLQATGANEHPQRKPAVEWAYVLGSVLVYGLIYFA